LIPENTNEGSALFINTVTNVYISDTVITNTTGPTPAFMMTYMHGTVIVERTTFDSNSARGYTGSAILIFNDHASAVVIFEDSIFSNNDLVSLFLPLLFFSL
jgi:hypothetical protein